MNAKNLKAEEWEIWKWINGWKTKNRWEKQMKKIDNKTFEFVSAFHQIPSEQICD